MVKVDKDNDYKDIKVTSDDNIDIKEAKDETVYVHDYDDRIENKDVNIKHPDHSTEYVESDRRHREYSSTDYDVVNSDYNVVNARAGYNLSWRAVLAGLITFLASSLMFSLIGTAIGLGVPTLTSSQPMEGVGTGLIIWLVVSLIISLGLAGYVAGITANRAGFVHGFLTWALSVITLFFLLTNAVIGTFNAMGNFLGMTGQAVGDAAQTVGRGTANLTEQAFNTVTEEMNVDTSELDGTVEEVLKDTDIPQLQPNYLQDQIDDSVNDITETGKAIVVDQEDPKNAFDDLKQSIQARVDEIGKELDHDQLVEAVSKNSDLSDQEAEQAVQNIEEAYGNASQEAEEKLAQAQTELDKLSEDAQNVAEEAPEVAEDVTNKGAKYSLYLFLGLLAALFLTSLAGHLGSKTTVPDDDYDHDNIHRVKYDRSLENKRVN
ncbi:hypothetical protein HZY91_00605 [Facklamia sp. DSM 111018]|uniref:Uncharacterized protein n=1 Tax=Facklamia lactis TaxID=2749967 RepID=A0ABS0LMX4_9LACT|nr:hypothetical protein [Facklamia lactis]MBG9979931.1 hypothetical protein [Facklamia lactis]MBG9985389.1 hypothetical protein [Facklamia lactis]